MLVLERKTGESIIIGDNIKLKIFKVQGNSVRIGIEAPREVLIYREEIYEEIKKENLMASGVNLEVLEKLLNKKE